MTEHKDYSSDALDALHIAPAPAPTTAEIADALVEHLMACLIDEPRIKAALDAVPVDAKMRARAEMIREARSALASVDPGRYSLAAIEGATPMPRETQPVIRREYPTVIGVTPGMFAAGVAIYHERVDYDGLADEDVAAIYLAMRAAEEP